ncbi:MAG: hypothetical protein H7336_16360 [Bacteriovorax sp.]|nr:hypothetical protein [Bacteriovorax sp.]
MKPFAKFKERVVKHWNDEEHMFKIGMGLKFLGVSVFCLLSVLLFTYLLIRIDLIFFVSHGFPGAAEFQAAFYEYIYSAFSDELIWIAIAAVFTFGLGYYLSGIMIRPFKVIGEYCDDKINNKKNFYTPDFFSDLKLLTSFSVFFFTKIDEAGIKGKLENIEIPAHFTRIHKPSFEKNFFFNYLFIIAIFALLSSLGIVFLNIEIRDHMFELAKKFLAHNNQVTYFLDEQFVIADIAVYFFVMLHLILYFLLGVHLYSKIATPAFAVFATMRSYLRGNHHNRVHLIGYYYLRKDCRKINKYLDHVQKNLT